MTWNRRTKQHVTVQPTPRREGSRASVAADMADTEGGTYTFQVTTTHKRNVTIAVAVAIEPSGAHVQGIPYGIGSALRHPDDKDNPQVGKALATMRAMRSLVASNEIALLEATRQ